MSTSPPGDDNLSTEGAGDVLNFQHFSVAVVDGHPVELGRGAMGITYKAYDRSLHVHVALKVINGAVLTSDTARDRFLREARSAAALRHPNVAAVFYLGEQDGSVFYAMEYVDGETIEACIRREIGVTPVVALKIVAQVASALAAAQKEGIIHRDIKPSNIMLMKSDDSDVSVKVIDFGLAKSIENDPNSATVTLTQGGFLGTPHFASPEQLEEGEVDTRSDIYSLGVTLFYMLAGKTPFSGSMAQVMSQHLYRQPPLELLEGQPAIVMDLLKSMLAKDPDERPQTALELKKRAEACLEELAFLGGTGTVTRAPAARPDVGEIVGGRFTLEAPLGAAGEFLRFRARDAEHPDEPVEVVLVDPGATMIPGLREEVRQRVGVVERIEADAIRHIVAQGGSGRGWYFAVECVEGISLLQVMKARRSLELAEALSVLKPIAQAVDAFDRAQAPRPELAPHEILLTPAGDSAIPLYEWPDLRVKIDALRIEHLLDVPADITVVHSSAATLRQDGEDKGNAAFAVAGLAYEVLGGVRFDSQISGQWMPLSELTQEGNLVVRRALEGGFASAAEFVDALVGEGTSRTPAPVARIAEAMPPPLPLPEAPTPRRSRALAAILGLVALLLGAGIYFVWPRAQPLEPQAGPSTTPAPTSTPLVISEPNQTPAMTPAAAPERDAYAAEVARAAELEAAGNDGPALLAYAKLSSDHPEDGGLFESVKRLAQKIETEHPKGVEDAAELGKLRPGLEAAGWRGSENACVVLGNSLLKGDPVASLQWFQEAAKRGRSDAMATAGMMLSSGRGVSKPNPEAAVGWFQAAADRNDMNGITYLGECYSRGYGVAQDDKRAVELLTTSSEMGDDRAMGLLGRLYESGRGVEKPDPQKAFDLYKSAAAKGNLNAQAQLGRLWITGVGVARNPAEAVRLWKDGAEKGNSECMRLYAMSLEDESLANDPKQAREWYVKSAQAGNDRAIAWCQEHNVTFDEPPVATPAPAP